MVSGYGWSLILVTLHAIKVSKTLVQAFLPMFFQELHPKGSCNKQWCSQFYTFLLCKQERIWGEGAWPAQIIVVCCTLSTQWCGTDIYADINYSKPQLYAHINLHSMLPPPFSAMSESTPGKYRYLTLIVAYILSPGGLGMVGKVVNVQAWKKESAVSCWMSSVWLNL